MGIPKYFRHITGKYPTVVKNVDTKVQIQNLYFDMNCLIHPCVRTVTKEYPDKIILNITEYEELIVVTDLRGTFPRRTILYKNGLEIISADINNLPTISILNGPVQAGFNGELISMMMTFKNYELDLSTFTFNYDGQKIVGVYRETTVDFGPSLNLGIKAAALGSLLENSNCSGEIKFIGSEELIANC